MRGFGLLHAARGDLGAAVEADGALAHHLRPPARHASVGARVRARCAVRGGRGGAAPHGGALGDGPRVAHRALGDARALGPRVPAPARPRRRLGHRRRPRPVGRRGEPPPGRADRPGRPRAAGRPAREGRRDRRHGRPRRGDGEPAAGRRGTAARRRRGRPPGLLRAPARPGGVPDGRVPAEGTRRLHGALGVDPAGRERRPPHDRARRDRGGLRRPVRVRGPARGGLLGGARVLGPRHRHPRARGVPGRGLRAPDLRGGRRNQRRLDPRAREVRLHGGRGERRGASRRGADAALG